jgi:hypothetical protein
MNVPFHSNYSNNNCIHNIIIAAIFMLLVMSECTFEYKFEWKIVYVGIIDRRL